MKKRTAELILKDPEKFAHHDRVFLNNPVVMQGMGLAPLVVVATTGQNSLMLSAAWWRAAPWAIADRPPMPILRGVLRRRPAWRAPPHFPMPWAFWYR